MTVARTLLAGTRRAPGRLLLTGLAIAVATLFAADTLMLGDTLRAFLATTGQQTPTTAAVVVVPPDEPPGVVRADRERAGRDLSAAVRHVDGVADAAELWSAVPVVLGAGAGTAWEFRSDPLTGPLGRAPGGPLGGRLPAGQDEVAVTGSTATRTGVRLGQQLWLVGLDQRRHPVTVTGVVGLRGTDHNTLIGAPDAVVAVGGRLAGLDVAARPGQDPAALAARVRPVVDPATAVRTGDEQRASEAATSSESVRATLLGVQVFAGLSVVAAVVIVASAFRIVLTQRRTQLALLRCVGAGRRRLVGAVLVEAAGTGLLAGAAGIGVAVLVGHGVLDVLRSGSGADLGPRVLADGVADLPDLVLRWPALVAVLAVAVLATVLAATGPALAASRVSPLAALGAAPAGETGSPRTSRRLLGAGLLALAATGLMRLAVREPGRAGILLLAGSGLLVFAALVAAGPVLASGEARLVGLPVSLLGGAAGRLAAANAAAVPRRTAATVSVLTLGVGLTAALLVALTSTRADAEASVDELFPSAMVLLAPDEQHLDTVVRRLTGDLRLGYRVDGLRVLVDPVAGLDPAAGRRAAEDGAGPDAIVGYAVDARAQVDHTLDGAGLLGLALVGTTAVVAVVGVAVTSTLSVAERVRETGLLRTLGLTRRGVRAMVAWEAAMAGLAAALLGGVIGAGYGLLAARILGVGVGFVPSTAPMLGALVVGVTVVAALAAAVPAVRAGRVPPIAALVS